MVLQNNKIKILITASTFPRWDNDSVPYFVLEQVKALQSIASDAELHILAPHHEGAKLLENWDGITIHRFRYFWPEKLQKLAYPAILPNVRHNKFLAFQIPFLLLFEFIAIFRLCKKISPNLLYSHWFVPQGVVGGLVALIFKIPHVYTSHSSDIQIMNRLPILGPFLVRFFSGKSKACTVVSKRSLNKLKDFYNEKQWDDFKAKVKIIPMGVDTNLVKNLELRDIDHFKQELGLTGEKIILFIGRLSEKK